MRQENDNRSQAPGVSITRRTSFVCALWLATLLAVSAQAPFTDESEITKFLHEHFDGANTCIVVGLLDERGSRTFSAGKLDNGTDANSDTLFEIGSITK